MLILAHSPNLRRNGSRQALDRNLQAHITSAHQAVMSKCHLVVGCCVRPNGNVYISIYSCIPGDVEPPTCVRQLLSTAMWCCTKRLAPSYNINHSWKKQKKQTSLSIHTCSEWWGPAAGRVKSPKRWLHQCWWCLCGVSSAEQLAIFVPFLSFAAWWCWCWRLDKLNKSLNATSGEVGRLGRSVRAWQTIF